MKRLPLHERVNVISIKCFVNSKFKIVRVTFEVMKKLFLFLLTTISISFLWAQNKPEGLFINSKAPDFKLKDQDGKDVSLRELKKKGPVVIVFYRGNWCPYCNKYLQRLQDSLQLI